MKNYLSTINNLIKIMTVKDKIFIKRENVHQAGHLIFSILNQVFEVQDVLYCCHLMYN